MLLRRTAFLIVFFAMCIIFACGIGHLQPTPISDLFTNPDGSSCEMPCLFGVKAGNSNMSAEEALRLLASHPLTRGHKVSYSKKWHNYMLEGKESSIVLSVTDTGYVEWLQIEYMPYSAESSHAVDVNSDALDQHLAKLTLGHVVAFMEPPCNQSTSLDMGMEQIWLSFQRNDLTFGHRLSNPVRIELDDPLWFIHLSISTLDRCSDADWTTWHGFQKFDLGGWSY